MSHQLTTLTLYCSPTCETRLQALKFDKFCCKSVVPLVQSIPTSDFGSSCATGFTALHQVSIRRGQKNMVVDCLGSWQQCSVLTHYQEIGTVVQCSCLGQLLDSREEASLVTPTVTGKHWQQARDLRPRLICAASVIETRNLILTNSITISRRSIDTLTTGRKSSVTEDGRCDTQMLGSLMTGA